MQVFQYVIREQIILYYRSSFVAHEKHITPDTAEVLRLIEERLCAPSRSQCDLIRHAHRTNSPMRGGSVVTTLAYRPHFLSNGDSDGIYHRNLVTITSLPRGKFRSDGNRIER